MTKEIANELFSDFFSRFHTKPLIAFAPGRINIIGEHTDYNEGFVLPAAINLGVAVAIQFSDSSECSVYAKDLEQNFSFSLDQVPQPKDQGSWKNFIIGVVKEIQKKGIQLLPFNLVFCGTLPIGSGLSSSAALENALIVALTSLQNLGITKHDMALMAQQAEHHAVGVNCGIMDQYSSMFGVKNHALLIDCKNLVVKPVLINLESYEFLLINTNVKHSLAESAYNQRRLACERVAKSLNVPSLRYSTIDDLNRIKHVLESKDYDKALFVLQENERVLAAEKALKAGDLLRLGCLLFESHSGLRYLYDVSCDELDFLVDEAEKSPAVIGARMMGGGFGGFTINLVRKDEVQSFYNEVSGRFFEKFRSNCTALSIEISQGARILKVSNYNGTTTRTLS